MRLIRSASNLKSLFSRTHPTHVRPSSSLAAATCIFHPTVSPTQTTNAHGATNLARYSSLMESKFKPANRLKGFDRPTVWHEFTPLAQASKAINLGQGFPDWETPEFVKKAAQDAIDKNENQYARSAGHPDLVAELAKDYSDRWGRKLDPLTEVTTTIGCTEALYCTLQGLVNEGDEIVVIEPFFDIYTAQVQMAGGTLKSVPLRWKGPSDASDKPMSSASWTLDLDELKSTMSDKTKVLIINTPHNPTGKIFTRKELEGIAAVVKSFDQCVVVSDEVYEHMVYDGNEHLSMAQIDGMYERTLTLGSSGKTFSCTGWKVGWVVGPPALVKCVALVNQWVTFSVTTPMQAGVAEALRVARQPYEGFPSYYAWLCDQYLKKRTKLLDMLTEAGITPIVPEGGFFILGSTDKFSVPKEYEEEGVTRDWALCRYLTKDVGVCAIPPSAFYTQKNKEIAKNIARFAFCKTDAALDEAAKRFKEKLN